jgi:glyoxylase-like metal-dependent hydrolase (beta-lactamase superfamily II)
VLRQVAEGVLVHQSELLQNNAVVVQGRAGVLLIDPGIRGDEMACLANDLSDLGQPVVAGFSTHPDWDHVLWHAKLGEAPRYGRARCAAYMQDLLSNTDWKARVAEGLPPEIAEEIPLDLFGLITGLPAETAADSLGWSSSADHRASGSCPGACGAVDRGTRRSRGRRHAF